ncbi:MAG: hypothetical protein IKD58_09620 [Loktanella sp.]|nr:hypothetical protein [Loktanella sp.]
MLLLRGKSTYLSCSNLRSHLSNVRFGEAALRRGDVMLNSRSGLYLLPNRQAQGNIRFQGIASAITWGARRYPCSYLASQNWLYAALIPNDDNDGLQTQDVGMLSKNSAVEMIPAVRARPWIRKRRIASERFF